MTVAGIIYRVVTAAEWAEIQRVGAYEGAAHDKADGFIHFSTGAQLRETLRLHYARLPNLMLLAVVTESVARDLKWEPSRGGDLFPHLFARLPRDLISEVLPLALGADGLHVVPERIA